MYHYRMKTKPILIVAALAFAAACGIFIAACKTAKTTEKAAVLAFLKDFNTQVKAGHTKSALAFFEDGPNTAANKALIKVLAGKSTLGGKGKPLFKVGLDVDAAGIDFTNPQAIVAVVPAKFKHDSVPGAASHVNFTLHKVDGKQYKIVAAKVDDFASDYALYQNKVINATVPEADIYSPETLAAFKTAEQLQTKYDSVLWFQHVNKKTWFYVIKGKIGSSYYWEDRVQDQKDIEHSDFKMGLVNPDLKEIIPVEYSLIHNISGTIDGLIEVEKGDKKGFYNLTGKLVVPAEYDQVYPLTTTDNLALLKNGPDYFYLKADSTISGKIADFKIADALPQIKTYGESYELTDKSTKNFMEYNSRDRYTSLVVSPSYLVDWNILDKFMNFQNPLRKLTDDEEGDGEGSLSLSVKYLGEKQEEGNWFTSLFYSVVDDYLGGRSGLYATNNVVIVDKKQNKVYGFTASNYIGNEDGGGELTGPCHENYVRAINDSLFEFKTTSTFYSQLFDEGHYILHAPYFHYLQIKNGKLVALKTERLFPTQFIKMDDSYLQGCYTISYQINDSTSKTKVFDHATPEVLQYMKNEIYGSYKYKFKSDRWNGIFEYRFYNSEDTTRRENVDDSLTVIDKYNIEFINRKLQVKKPAVVALR